MPKDLRIDWKWVEKELLRLERISPIEPGGIKNPIQRAASKCLEEARHLVSPRVRSITIKTARVSPGCIELEGTIKIPGKRIASYLKSSSYVYIFLATIGGRLEMYASARMKKEPLEGYLLDHIGSLTVESLAEDVGNRIRKKFGSGNRSVSMPFSPGYCDWPLDGQYTLDRALDFSSIGVSLTEGCMMVPRKSISAAIGIGPRGAFGKAKLPCALCDKGDCDYRKVR